MGVPSSMKFSKNGVTFESKVDRANYYIRELTRAALRDVGRFVARMCTKEVRKLRGLKKTKYVQKRYQFWVRKLEGDLQVGIHNIKSSKNPGATWYGIDQELGSNGQPKRGILRGVVYDNVQQIREIEAQYLSAIEDELKAQRLIESEAEYEGDGDGD